MLACGYGGPHRPDDSAAPFNRLSRHTAVLRSSVTAAVPMAPFTVALEHPVVVPVAAVHPYVARLDGLFCLPPFLLAIPVPVTLLDERLIVSFRQFLLRFQPELDTIPRRLSCVLPFLVGTEPNVFCGD